MNALQITLDALAEIETAAATAGDEECMGLLAGRREGEIITVATQLPAETSRSSAIAAPEAIVECVAALKGQGLVPKGMWHSHGGFSVFHSGTDQATIEHLLPAMAPANFQRSKPRLVAPVVVAPDVATLPGEDGFDLECVITGEPIPGTDSRLRSAWAEIAVGFADPSGSPAARWEGEVLSLESGGVVLRLTVPSGATLTMRKVDAAPYRVARLFSLVVNRRGERCAECVSLWEIGEQCVTEQKKCGIHVIAAAQENGAIAVPRGRSWFGRAMGC